MDYKSIYYPESRFGGFTDIDGTIAFYTRVNALLTPDSTILDVGCGRGENINDDNVGIRRNFRNLRGKCKKVIGIDVDYAARNNPFIDEFKLLQNIEWPLANETIDLCLCDNVIEHVKDIDKFFGEIRRVLKPEGYLCLRTPNILSYFGLCSKIIFPKKHPDALSKVQKDRKHQDIFPTFYRCNTKRKLSRKLKEYNFDAYVYGYEAEPSYLSFSRISYALGVWHQRFAPNAAKITLFGFGIKKRLKPIGYKNGDNLSQ
jgi:SAM-dependent methyltransferase